MSEPGEGSRRIKVVDRRRFDDSGDVRPDMPPLQQKPAAAPAAAPASSGGAQTPEAARSAPEPGRKVETSPLFLDLVAGLAQQAEILLNGGHGMPAQPAEAKRVIEYLSMLEGKTTGNLSGEEKQLLSNVIFQLRSMYVQATK